MGPLLGISQPTPGLAFGHRTQKVVGAEKICETVTMMVTMLLFNEGQQREGAQEPPRRRAERAMKRENTQATFHWSTATAGTIAALASSPAQRVSGISRVRAAFDVTR